MDTKTKTFGALASFLFLMGQGAFADYPRIFDSSWESRQDDYPKVSIEWKSQFIYRDQAYSSSPFGGPANVTNELFDVTAQDRGKFLLSGNDIFMRHYYSGENGQSPIQTEYNWIRGEFRDKLSYYGYGHQGKAKSPSHPYNLFSSLAFIYRPLSSDRYSMIKSLKTRTSKPDSTWGNREVVSLVAKIPGGTKEIFFDSQHTAHYLGTRSRRPTGEEFAIEIFPKPTGKFEIDRVVETLKDSNDRIIHQYVYSDFTTDYSSTVLDSEMRIEFEEGMQIRKKDADGKTNRFVFTQGQMEVETKDNRHKYNSRVWQPNKH